MPQKLGEMVWLFDFYGELLTKKQQEIFKLYYFQDLSLAEIAENYSISRQAVYDIIKRTEELLTEYEQKLNLYKKFLYQKQELEKLRTLLLNLDMNYDKKTIQQSIQCLDDLIKLTTCD
ncbi:MAG: uncharacterized protein PWQ96_379 [Clostridia bacterium]|jgi:hypothetical protein|nr:putative helix-turn-helix protein YlxM/p13 family protein [Clostridiales bacterium]MDK2984737.1 uncharacterized protein [Clostridia bacterium]